MEIKTEFERGKDTSSLQTKCLQAGHKKHFIAHLLVLSLINIQLACYHWFMPEGHQGQRFAVHMRTQVVLEEWKMGATMKSVTLIMDNGKPTGELYSQPKAFYWKVENFFFFYKNSITC